MQELASELGLDDSVLWLGPRQEMTSVYSALDALVSSSSFAEGFSNVIAEAMCCGVPCAATRVGDSAQIIADLGFTASAANPEELASAMNALLAVSREDMEERKGQCRKRIVENFSVPALVKRTREVLTAFTTAPQPATVQPILGANA
jgi:glycosyltransferase involved in cell wall biosynthesis